MLPDVRRDRTAAAAKSPPQILLLAEEELGVHDEGEILLLRISSTEVSGYTMMPHDKGEHEHHHQYPHCNGQHALAEGLERCGTVYLERLLDLDRNGVVTAANVPNTQGNATAVSGNSASRGCGCQRWKQRRGGGIFCQRRFSKEHFADP